MTIAELAKITEREVANGNGNLVVLVVEEGGTYARINRTYIDDIGGPGETAIYFFVDIEGI